MLIHVKIKKEVFMPLLDNSDGNTVFEWIEKYSDTGEIDVVTGYFTIGALSWISENFNDKINKFRFVWGGIAGDTNDKIVRIDLLNQDIGIEKVLELKKIAINAVEFLRQNKVEIKTCEPNFCHAKMFLLKTSDDRNKFYITGSSNLTESGIGQRKTSNVELNIANTGNNNEYKELANWFNDLWNNNQKVHNAKEKFIEEISKIFKEYTPNDIYLKICTEMGLATNTEIETKLENSIIYNALYDFQKKGAASLINMLENNNGAILADAVGLGKTWTALAVIKYYQKKGFTVIVFCPKKLENNWKKWKKNFNSRFERDNFDYFIRFHTDLDEDLMQKKAGQDTSDVFFTDEKPKLFVIDESHNLRSEKSKRYNFLSEYILKKNESAKILMLSATPINNSLLDVRNQLKLVPRIDNIDSTFRNAQVKFKKWTNEENPRTADLMEKLEGIVEITDKFVVARTRNMIEQNGLNFPKWEKPKNYYITPNCVENCNSCDELTNLLPTRFAAYMPAVYAGKTSEIAIKDESRRDWHLVKMMHFMLLKRLESSWFSFRETVKNILKYHKDVLEKTSKYQDFESQDFDDDEMEDLEESDFEIGKRRKIKIEEIENISAFKKDLTEDIKTLQNLFDKLERFDAQRDDKLSKLLEIIKDKPKALIFTAYKDTAKYLYENISSQKIGDAALISGDTKAKEIENILQKFAPRANFEESEKTAQCEQKRNDALKEEIKFLIATDVLSEGQNLQDCDFVINYDIHWNPVRIIQRMGRIDRIGSEYETIHCANFWPTKDINDYLNLQSRIETKMTAMKIAGSEIPKEFTENSKVVDDDKTLERKQMENHLKLMQSKGIDEIESENFGMNNLSLESFRQDLTAVAAKIYKDLPNGIFSGFKSARKGIIALLQNKKDKEHKLIFVDEQGGEIFVNEFEILKFLQDNKNMPRYIPESIENCDEQAIREYSNILNKWFEAQIPQMIKNSTENLFAGKLPKNLQECVEEKYIPDNWDLICWELISNEN